MMARRIAASLAAAGSTPALVGAQGSSDTGARVALVIGNAAYPGQELFTLHLGRCGVATSGKNRRNWTRNGLLHHHIIDPRTGIPAQSDVLTATVVAPTVLEAEAAAKALLILGSQAGMAWLEANPLLAGLLILEDGQVVCNTLMQEYL